MRLLLTVFPTGAGMLRVDAGQTALKRVFQTMVPGRRFVSRGSDAAGLWGCEFRVIMSPNSG